MWTSTSNPFILILCTVCILFAASSCDFSSQFMTTANNTSEIKVKRFDRLEYQYLTTGEFSALQQMSTDFPTETRTLVEDILRIGQMNEEETNKRFLTFFQDSLLQSLMRDTEEKFANMDKLNNDLTDAFRQLNKALPKIAVPHVYSQITALDQSIVIKDGSIGISLDKYLGKDYAPYKEFFTEEQLAKMTPKMIVPDCILFYLISLYPLEDYNTASQEERDMHIGKMQYLTNKIVGFRAYNDEPQKKIASYLKLHKDVTIESMFEEMDDSK